jgi:transcriptional regulator with XRE-family HTH domain
MNNLSNGFSGIMFDVMNTAEFTEWLNQRIQSSGLSQAQIARRGNISPASVSNALDINGSPVGWDVAFGIAQALGEPPLLVFRKAGLIPSRLGDDSLREEAVILFNELEKDDQEETLEFMRMKYRRTQLKSDARTLETTLQSIPPDAIDDVILLIDDFAKKHGYRRTK